jgi:putative membrane protein
VQSLLAHAGQPATPHDLWSSWGTDPAVYSGLLLGGWLYLRGLRRLWDAAGVGRGVSRIRAASFFAGLVVCWVALESPVDALGSALFSGHMLQHELLAVVAAPLLVLGEPAVVVPRALPPRWRRRLGRVEHRITGAGRPSASGPRYVAAFLVFAGSFWVWHAPALYNAALRSDVVHSIQHVTFLTGALVFWYAAISRRGRRNPLAGVALGFAATLQGAWGGTVFVFSNQAVYDPYLSTTQPWGLEPAQDTNLGGVIMLAAGPIFLLTVVALLTGYLSSMDDQDKDPTTIPAATTWP